MRDLIDLQNAHVTKHPGAGQPWKVEANISNDPLARLTGSFTESQVFEVLGFARKFEQLAFNAGVAFQKTYSAAMYKGQIEQLKEMNTRAGRENERLANIIEAKLGAKE